MCKLYTQIYQTKKFCEGHIVKANEKAAKFFTQIMTLEHDMAYKTPPPPKKGWTAQGDN